MFAKLFSYERGACPKCGAKQMSRIRRSFLMKLFGVTQYLRCPSCKREYIEWRKRYWPSSSR